MKLSYASFVAVATAASFAVAHGPTVQIGVAGDKIVTYGLAADTVNYTDTNPQQHAYVIPMTQRSLGDANDGWYAQPNPAHPFFGPGIAYGGRGFAGGVEIRETIADGLKRWDGGAFADPGLEEIQGVNNIALPTSINISTATGKAAGFALTTPAAVSATAHTQVYWRLLGDGAAPTAASDDGVYLLTLRLSTTQSGVATSDPYYLLLTKNASAADATAAEAYVNATLVPEPASLAALGLATGGLLTRRRRA